MEVKLKDLSKDFEKVKAVNNFNLEGIKIELLQVI